MQELKINYKFTTLNEYIKAERTPRVGYIMANRIKKRETDIVCLLAKTKLMKIDKPVNIEFTWLEKTARRDLDNIAFCQKYILDGLVKAGIIENDTQKYIKSLYHQFQKADDYGVIIKLMY